MRRSRLKPFACASALLLLPLAAAGQGWAVPLTQTPGDPVAGRAVVTAPDVGLCTLCHAGPFPEVPFMGNLAPDLTGVGARLTEAELRQRMVDSRSVNPDSLMPPYFATDNLTQVAVPRQGTTILTARQIEDVIAYLATLKGETR